jgi:group I intron endonuclease
MKKSGIYKITNPKGEVYIGYSKDLDKRKNDYKLFKIKTQPLILESLYTYGWINHNFEILEYTNNLKEREKYWVEKFDSFNNGLNSNKGGGGPKNHTEETKKLISEKGKLNKGKRINSHWKGKPKPEHIIEANKSNKGKRIHNSHWKGKTRSEETKYKMSQAQKGKPKPLNNKPILQYTKQGEFIQEHPSIEEAAKNIGGNPTAINNALIKGGEATSASYIWKYKN